MATRAATNLNPLVGERQASAADGGVGAEVDECWEGDYFTGRGRIIPRGEVY